LLAATVGSVISVVGFVMAGRHLRADIDAIEAGGNTPASNG
jgi:hypothetical protein